MRVEEVPVVFRSGRRLFSAGSIGLVVVAGLHTMGHFSSPQRDPVLDALELGMRSYSIDMGMGMRPTLYGVVQSLSLTMSVVLLGLGAQNLLVASSSGATRSLILRLSIASAIVTSGLTALYAYYQIPPPFITLGIVALLFIGSIVTAGRAE